MGRIAGEEKKGSLFVLVTSLRSLVVMREVPHPVSMRVGIGRPELGRLIGCVGVAQCVVTVNVEWQSGLPNRNKGDQMRVSSSHWRLECANVLDHVSISSSLISFRSEVVSQSAMLGQGSESEEKGKEGGSLWSAAISWNWVMRCRSFSTVLLRC